MRDLSVGDVRGWETGEGIAAGDCILAGGGARLGYLREGADDEGERRRPSGVAGIEGQTWMQPST